MTTGARDSHRVIGMDCPSMNWEAAALKKGSRASGKKKKEKKNYKLEININELPWRQNVEFICSMRFKHMHEQENRLIHVYTFHCVGERDSNSCKGDIASYMA